MEEYNTVIIGSGISGMTAAIYLKRASIKTLIIEKEIPGGQLNKACTIENYPGISSVKGVDLALNIYNQLMEYNPDYLYEEPKKIDLENNIIETSTTKIKYQNLIIATGRRSKQLNLPNEKKYLGYGISFCASCDGALYKNETVAVIGGANSALTEALYLSKICKKVYIIYRKDQLRGEKILKEKINNTKNIEIIYNQTIKEYITKENKVIGLILDNNTKMLTSCIFIAIGFLPNTELFNLKKENNYIVVDNNYQTSQKNVYACGDVIKKTLYQLITASSEGAIVANNIINNQIKK